MSNRIPAISDHVHATWTTAMTTQTEWEEAMLYGVAIPDMPAAAAANVAGIGSSLSTANVTAAALTTRLTGARG